MGQARASAFRPAWWLRGPHAQTVWPSLFRRRPRLTLSRRRVELADGDFIDLSIASQAGPTVLVIHGLEGDLQSHYGGTIMAALAAAGFRAVFVHLRGCSDEPNRLPRSYHSGATEDLVAVLDHLAATPEDQAIAAVGYSLGGNLLLKHLGETALPRLRAAVAVSVPFVLRDAMLRLGFGASRLYQRHLLARLKASYAAKFARIPSPLSVDLDEIQDFYQYDDRITAPLNGFSGAEDYYARCSCRPLLHRVETPTLILHAADDPFMFPHTVPEVTELGAGVKLELAERGGHVGFVSGLLPWRPRYWLDGQIVRYLLENAV
ncbi:MAG: hydrolase [Chromatiaceae bacterium]